MPSAQFLLLWMHLISAVAWIGGMLFLSLVLAPLVRGRTAVPDYAALFRTAALRFRRVVWTAMVVLLGTGPLLLQNRGWSLFEPQRWPAILQIKLGLVGLLLTLTVSHDLVLGPRMSKIGAPPAAARTPGQRALLRTATWLPRMALLLALAVVGAAVILART